MNTQLLEKLNSINNINIKSVEGESLIGFYVDGTSFAKERATQILKEFEVEFSIMRGSGTISFAFLKL